MARSFILSIAAACAFACSDQGKTEDAGDSAADAGASESGTGASGANHGGTNAATGGVSGGGDDSGGVGGRAGSGGSTAHAGSAGSGGSSSAGSHGSDAAIDGGAVDDADAGGTDAAVTMSAGCGTASPPSGTLAFDVSGQSGQYVITIPSDYDPAHAYPLGFAFHGRDRTGPNCHDGDCAGFDTAMHEHAVLVYMTSLGGTGWEGDGEREINVEFFETLRTHVEQTYCIDTSRVFVAGTSSGAHFVNVLACRFGDRLLAVVPVAGYLPERDNCAGEVAAMVIHGVDDSHVPFSNGEEARNFFLERNGCTMAATPPIAELHQRVVAARESHECASYAGCDPGKPVVWCEHSEGGYDDSTHGWPLFGGDQIWAFVQTL